MLFSDKKMRSFACLGVLTISQNWLVGLRLFENGLNSF